MFAAAIAQVTPFTLPVIVSVLYPDRVECSCATCIVLNAEGWALTAAHVLEPLLQAEAQRGGQSFPEPQRVLQHSFWLGHDGWRISEYYTNGLADLALLRLDGFEPARIAAYPVFAGPQQALPIGRSLCRLGHPLHRVAATWDPAAQTFRLAHGTVPVPRFPLEGIHTRLKLIEDAQTGRQASFIELSTPGLRGQSGGPVFTADGVVWGLQSHTDHYDLGFRPAPDSAPQYLHVGQASHVCEITALLRQHNVLVAEV